MSSRIESFGVTVELLSPGKGKSKSAAQPAADVDELSAADRRGAACRHYHRVRASALLTLGLFLLVINGLTIELACCFLKGYGVNGRWPARRTTKTHAMVDSRGRPIALEVTPGRLGDVRVAISLIGAVRPAVWPATPHTTATGCGVFLPSVFFRSRTGHASPPATTSSPQASRQPSRSQPSSSGDPDRVWSLVCESNAKRPVGTLKPTTSRSPRGVEALKTQH